MGRRCCSKYADFSYSFGKNSIQAGERRGRGGKEEGRRELGLLDSLIFLKTK